MYFYRAMSEMLNKIKEYLESPEGKLKEERYFAELKVKKDIAQVRYSKIEKYLESTSFDVLVQRLFSEHNEQYCDNSYKKGIEPGPNNKMQLLFDYLGDRLSPISVPEIESELHFNTTIYFFKGYYFVIMYGQGCAYLFFNLNKKRIFTL